MKYLSGISEIGSFGTVIVSGGSSGRSNGGTTTIPNIMGITKTTTSWKTIPNKPFLII